jgi:hypothetical protein
MMKPLKSTWEKEKYHEDPEINKWLTEFPEERKRF